MQIKGTAFPLKEQITALSVVFVERLYLLSHAITLVDR